MSYDLYFVTRDGQRLDAERVEQYFMGRPHVTCERPEYTYLNEATGVYFQFTVDEGEQDAESGDSPASFNINYFRPSCFVHEAEPEVSAFVKAFDLMVSDPQIGGMGEGEYDPAGFTAGWNQGNEFAYRALLTTEGSAPERTLTRPRADLMDVWRWNHGKDELQESLGTEVFVPRISYMLIDGSLATAAVWPDAIPIAIRRVDHFIIGREQFAPKRFFMRRKDLVVITWEQAAPWLEKYRSRSRTDCLLLDYVEPPADLAAFIEGLPAGKPAIEGVPDDQVLDRELVEHAKAMPPGRRSGPDLA